MTPTITRRHEENMRYREEDYDQVHDQIISNLQIKYEDLEDAIKLPYYDVQQKEVARSAMKRIKQTADKIRS